MTQTHSRSPSADQNSNTCSRCGKSLNQGWAFAFKSPEIQTAAGEGLTPGETCKCFPCAVRHVPMLKRSVMAGIVVGTILTALNQGDLIVTGQWGGALLWKIPLTYCVPFLVATYGALTNSRK